MDDAAFHEAYGGDNHPQPDGCSICLAWSIHVSHGGGDNPDPEHCRICLDAWLAAAQEEEEALNRATEQLANTLNQAI